MEDHLKLFMKKQRHTIGHTTDMIRCFETMTLQWIDAYRSWYETTIQEERYLYINRWYDTTANLIRSEIQCLYQLVIVSRQFSASQTIRILMMWLNTNTDNRIEQRFLYRQARENQRLINAEKIRHQDLSNNNIAEQVGHVIQNEKKPILNLKLL